MRYSFFFIIVLISINNSFSQANLPSNFSQLNVLDANILTGLASLPDNRVIATTQDGDVFIINTDNSSTMILSLSNVSSFFERGLQTAAVDPDFENNNYIYLYYTLDLPGSGPVFNKIERYTLNGSSLINPVLILQLPNLSAGNHNGGGMCFGDDGKLYIAVGDNAVSQNSQSTSTLFGKILRINADGSIPTDNPYYNTLAGSLRAIYCIGLRNPFKMYKDPGSSKIYVNDVGQSTREEVNQVGYKANFGWPEIEGFVSEDPSVPNPLPDNYRDPIQSYSHAGGNCSITGGSFYNPSSSNWPSIYYGKYFYFDYCSARIWFITPPTSTSSSNPISSTQFATNAGLPVDMTVTPNGNMYYTHRSFDVVYKVTYDNSNAVSITDQPDDVTLSTGGNANFMVSATGGSPFTYDWYVDDLLQQSGASSSFTMSNVGLIDDGKIIHVEVSNASSFETSTSATLTVIPNTPPVATILTPTIGTKYNAGTTISFAGSGTDTEDGNLGPGDLFWYIDFHHDDHAHPGLGLSAGSSGTYDIPNIGEISDNVWYRIYLIAIDSDGATDTTYVEVFPNKSDLIFDTYPSGGELTIDGVTRPVPDTITSVVGILRSAFAPNMQNIGGVDMEYSYWSDHKSQLHNVATPSLDSTFIALYKTMEFEKVGLGTDSPLSQLHLRNGDVFIEDVNGGIIFNTKANGYFRISIESNSAINSSSTSISPSTGLGFGTSMPMSLAHISNGNLYIENPQDGIIFRSEIGIYKFLRVDISGNIIISTLINPPTPILQGVSFGAMTPLAEIHIPTGSLLIDNPSNGVVFKHANNSCHILNVSDTGELQASITPCP